MSASPGYVPRVVEILIEGDPLREISINKLLRVRHWSQRSRPVKRWRERAAYAWIGSHEKPFATKVLITYTVTRVRRLDPDKAVGALAPLLDGLVHPYLGSWRSAGLVPDDTSQFIEMAPVQWVTGPGWKGREMVKIRVETLEEKETS